jgi:hypothetical protein
VEKELVKMDISKGLLPKLEVVWRLGYFSQILYYWKVSFICVGFQEIGNLRKHFLVSMDFLKAKKGWVNKSDISLTNEVVTIQSMQV